jgi:hypothetical protein
MPEGLQQPFGKLRVTTTLYSADVLLLFNHQYNGLKKFSWRGCDYKDEYAFGVVVTLSLPKGCCKRHI